MFHMSVPDWLYEAKRNMELAIMGTPTNTGEVNIRSRMTDVNMAIISLMKDVEEYGRPKPE